MKFSLSRRLYLMPNGKILIRNPLLEQRTILRINECRYIQRANCVGTALYIVGMRNSDSHANTKKTFRQEIKRLKRTEKPKKGCLVVWQNTGWHRSWWAAAEIKHLDTEILHMGVVASLGPLSVIHRDGLRGAVERSRFVDLHNLWATQRRTIAEFYLPKSNSRIMESKRG